MDWPFIALSVVATFVGLERVWQLRDDSPTLTEKAILVALFSVGVAAAAYGTMELTAGFLNIGLVVWHVLAAVIIGSLEMVLLTLRTENVQPAAVRAIKLRCLTVVVLLLVSWPLGLADAPATRSIDSVASYGLSAIVSLTIFPAYIIWGLSQVVILSLRRLPADIRRRPISTLALLMIATGSAGFIWINLVMSFHLLTAQTFDREALLAPAPLFLALCVGGAVLLAAGERLHEELRARLQLRRLTPLWERMIELSSRELHLPARTLPTPARAQRAYVEISDAICTLRVSTKEKLDLVEAVEALRRGDVTDDPDAPTLSQALPPRRTRRDDIQLIHALAREYR